MLKNEILLSNSSGAVLCDEQKGQIGTSVKMSSIGGS